MAAADEIAASGIRAQMGPMFGVDRTPVSTEFSTALRRPTSA
jgi:hypothetical protein